MSRGKNLLKNTFIYFIGTFGSKLLSFLLLPLYSVYLTQEAYGSYDLINTLVALLYPVITLMLDNAMFTFLIRPEGSDDREEIISVALKVFLSNSVIAGAIGLTINLIYPIRYMVWIIAWLISVSAYNLWIQICRGYNKPLIYSLTGIVMTTMTLLGNVVAITILKLDYKGLMMANILANFAACCFLEYHLRVIKCVNVKTANTQLKRRLLQYSIPLIPNTLSWWVINVSDRLMVTYFMGNAANGVYAMASKIPAILTIVHSIFSLAWADDILKSDDLKKTEQYANDIYNKYITAMIGLTAMLVCANRLIFEYVISGNFVESYKYTYFLYLGCFCSALSSCLGAFYGYYKKSANISIGSAVAAAVNFIINLIFIPVVGIQAAGISTFAGFLAMWLIRLYGLREIILIKITHTNKLLLLIFILLYFVHLIESLWINICLTITSMIFAAVINRDILRQGYRMIADKLSRK